MAISAGEMDCSTRTRTGHSGRNFDRASAAFLIRLSGENVDLYQLHGGTSEICER